MNESTAKRRAALWVAVVFVLGVAFGGVFGYFYGHRSVVMAGGIVPPPQLSEPERRARRLDQMTHELNLTDSQRQQIDTLLLQIHGEFQSIREKNAAQLETEMDQERHKSREQIRAVLTPEQMPKFEEFLKKLDEERKRNAANPGAPPPPSR
jgi:Spy/CpxP family protein refolding chaperone